MKSTRALGFRTRLPWPLRIVALILIPVHLLTATPASVTEVVLAEASRAEIPQQPPSGIFAEQHLLLRPRPPAVPVFSAPAREKSINADPEDRELMGLRLLEQPLVPLAGVAQIDENVALARALTAYQSHPEDVSALKSFIGTHASSRWVPAILVNLGLQYRSEGRLRKAQDALERGWKLAREEQSRDGKSMADRAIGELAQTYADLREFDRLDALRKEVEKRDVQGGGGARLQDACSRRDFIQAIPVEKRNRCGPLAVRELFRFLNPSKPLPKDRGKVEVTQEGAKLSDLFVYAKAHGLDYQIAFRLPGAEVLFPAVVHWKAGHYTWLKRSISGKYLSREATFGQETVISMEVLDEESSGYFLVPSGTLPSGWRTVSSKEAESIVGSGITTPGSDPTPPCVSTRAKPCPPCRGLANYNMDLNTLGLMLSDNPVGYTPPFGPPVQFTANYNSRDTTSNAQVSNLGNKWGFNLMSYVQADASVQYKMIQYGPGGGLLAYFGIGTPIGAGSGGTASPGSSGGGSGSASISANSLPQAYTQARIHVETEGYTVDYPDGSLEVFHQKDTGANPRYFRTKLIDPQGNALSFAYDEHYRLRTVTDAMGQVTVLDYELTTDPAFGDFYRITKVTDPFGRHATFQYNANGQLWKITDVIGFTSEFAYGDSDFVASLITPYGTTRFHTTEDSNHRVLEITDPIAGKERAEWVLSCPAIADSEAAVPDSVTDSYLQYRNTFYWDKKGMAEHPGEYAAARTTHWLHTAENGLSKIVESTKAPGESRIWYTYPGQESRGTHFEGSSGKATRVARMLDDGSQQNYYTESNAHGRPTKITDPLGREMAISYASGGIDAIGVRIKNGPISIQPGAAGDATAAGGSAGSGSSGSGSSATVEGDSVQVFEASYNTQHLPLTVTDAAGQITSYTYNSAGQLRTVTNAKGQTTTFWYHPTGQPSGGTALDLNAVGYLVKIDGPVEGASVSFVYDDFGRVRSTTDPQGYTVVSDYDIFDRPLKYAYPDNTYEQILYSRLDAEWLRDRQGGWTHQFWDANRHLTAMIDPSYRKTTYDWCGCGSLDSVVDPAGRRTTWKRDTQGRLIAKIYPDQSQETFTYDLASRIKTFTDAKGQVANYTYYVDSNLAAVTYTDSGGSPLSPATPAVTYNYDPYFQRLASIADCVGTTTYSYNPYSAYQSGQTIPSVPGAGRLAAIDGPFDDDTLSFTYDELGRVLTRTINGSANTVSVHYDTLGRIDRTTNALGTFNLGYVGVTDLLDHVGYPNGQRTDYAYYGNTAPAGTGNGDRRLSGIQNLTPSGVNLSSHAYSYNMVGQIQTWTRRKDSASEFAYIFAYDAVGQLIGASARSGVDAVTNYAYGYDLAGNRTREQIDNGVTTSAHNNLNQLIGQSPGGAMEFAGTLNERGTVTLAGRSAYVDAQNNWLGTATVTPGANDIALVATDASGNSTSKTIHITISGGTARNLGYDLAGNEIDNGAGQTYTYDALNRLKTITRAGNVSEFVYNGFGQRVQEKLNGSLAKQWIWDGGSQPAEERDASGNVTKRFFGGMGEQIAGTNYYYTRDHLGSVREMTDSSGAVRARYDYDPFGRQTKLSGDMDSDFGYANYMRDQASGLWRMKYRFYDPEIGRFISRDPIAEEGGLNLYAYVGNNPISLIDPLGLAYEITETQGLHYNDRSSKFGFKIVGDGFGGVRTAPMGGSHSYNVQRAESILARDLANPVKGQQLRDLIRDSFEKPSFQSSETYLREVGGGLRRTMQNLALLTMVLSVADVALRADEIAHNLVKHACEAKNGDGWGLIALHQDMQEMAPGMAGHWAWLVAIGNM
ncbi:hypothetical protein DB347_25230 [Opitutaceae bacterium EW11]|nr:hypothetical protein DB347_25230 [Opitutaceae bacterium EW11]